ncbi:uncharacterized protein [Setaria viridis]|uniref:uncharacterized protein n=1 Tax=Setaria viridis TaxID=4556 RepID=UPI0014937B78|nr:uncharacterized protein LOC117833244 [Setaria viridis]
MDRLGRIRPPPSWSNLLPELAGLILRLLLCRIDRLRFSCVCRRWRLAAQQQRPHLPPALPFICLKALSNYGAFLSLPAGEARRAGAVPAKDVTCHGCFDGWLLYGPHDRDNDDSHKCFLTNPLTGATVEMPLHLGDLAKSNVLYMLKFMVLSPDLIAALSGSYVAFYRSGAPSWSVSPSDVGGDRGARGSYYVDSAFYSGKIFALNTADELFVHEVGAAAADTVEHAIKAQGPQPVDPEEKFSKKRHYLVVSCTGKLLMVKWTTVPLCCRRPSPRNFDGITVEVFEADLEKGRWLEVSSLDDGEALFVGRGCSKAVRFTGHDERFQGNRVYALGYDNFFRKCHLAMPSYGFYDLRNGEIVKVLHDSMRAVAWPVSGMEWFFPLE